MLELMNATITRRAFIGAAAAALGGCATVAPPEIIATADRIVDTHTHFYDPTRPEGVPWPDKNDPVLYRTVLPNEYMAMARPLGITSTIVVEASPRVADNDWVLGLAKDEPFLAGLVGHLKPGTPEFANELARLATNPRFKGIRTGGWNISIAPENSQFMRDLGLLASRRLALDVLGGPDQLASIARLAKALPDLRIVVNHCGGVRIDGKSIPFEWIREIYPLADHPNVFMKVSGLPENTGRAGNAPTDADFYDSVLDTLWNAFGEDRLIFGSNWPVSARFATLSQILGIVRPWFEARGQRAAEKYFAGNARRVYRIG